MECGEKRNVDKYSFSNSRGIWHPLPWADACLNLENTRINTLRLKKTPRLLSLWPFPYLYSVRRAAGTAQEGSPLSWLNLPPQWVVPLKSLGSPTEGLNTNTSDWVPHLIPPLKQLAHQSLIEKIIWKALTKLKGLRYGEMDVQSRSSVLPDCHYLSCSYLSLQMEVSGLTGTWGTIALPSCLQDMLPLGFCFMQQQDQQGQVATLFLNHWHSFWIAKEVRMRADQAAWTQAGWHLGCEVSAMFSAFFVLSGPDRLLTGGRITCSSYSMCSREGQAVKSHFPTAGEVLLES